MVPVATSHGTTHDRARQPCPEAALVVGPPLEPAPRQQADRVEPASDERQHHGQERDGGDHRDRGDQEASDAEARA